MPFGQFFVKLQKLYEQKRCPGLSQKYFIRWKVGIKNTIVVFLMSPFITFFCQNTIRCKDIFKIPCILITSFGPEDGILPNTSSPAQASARRPSTSPRSQDSAYSASPPAPPVTGASPKVVSPTQPTQDSLLALALRRQHLQQMFFRTSLVCIRFVVSEF